MAGWIWSLIGVGAGCLLAAQGPINAELGRALGHPIGAAMVSFSVGAVALALVCGGITAFGGVQLHFDAPPLWLFLVGGVFGATFVTCTIILTPKLGAAALMAFAVTGQLLAGILLDRIGFMGMAVREISLGRVAGALLLIGGALLIRLT